MLACGRFAATVRQPSARARRAAARRLAARRLAARRARARAAASRGVARLAPELAGALAMRSSAAQRAALDFLAAWVVTRRAGDVPASAAAVAPSDPPAPTASAAAIAASRRIRLRTASGRANDAAEGMIPAASVWNHCSSSEQYRPRKSDVARRLPALSRPVPAASPGNSPIRPCLTFWPMTNAAPAAPWSVPEPFSAGRRPNSLHSGMTTRSATPRSSRSRQKARMFDAVARRLFEKSVAWLECVS